MIISSRTNPKYKHWLGLADRRKRKQAGEFLIEGKREVERALRAKVEITALVLAQETVLPPTIEALLNETVPSENRYILPQALFQKLSVREHPDGVLAIAKTWETVLEQATLRPQGLYLLVEGLEKPGNLGALMRSAEATHVDGFFIVDPRVDIFNPHVIRASQGAVFALNIYVGQAQQIYDQFLSAGLTVFATTPHATKTYWESRMTRGCVICVGSEAHGLSDFWMNVAEKIRIPMYGTSADSLNANISGTLCLYEACRQRHAAKLC